MLGKHSCAIKDLLSIFFHHFPPEYLDESATSVQENRRKEKEYEEEETDEELEAENQLHESSSENSEEYKDGREQLVSCINPYSSVTLSTATADPKVTDSRRECSESEGNDSHGYLLIYFTSLVKLPSGQNMWISRLKFRVTDYFYAIKSTKTVT